MATSQQLWPPHLIFKWQMSGNNKYVLVRKPSSAVGKVAPGAKRILSGMVADTLALVPARANAEAEGWYRKGHSYFVSENYTEAVKWYRKAAEQNNADAQNALGVCYHNGDGVPQDYAEALKWYRSAAEQGHARAQNNLGDFYYQNGLGLEKDYAEAVQWFRKAAEQRHWAAQFQLAECYSQGHGVAKDDAEAVQWYRKAAEQGSVIAQSRLAWCYCDSDKSEHVKWLRKAAEQGDEKAQARLRIILWMGGYLPEEQQDIVEAYKWERIRAEKEFDGIVDSNIKEFMTPEQIQMGEALAREFLSKAAR
jgi:TPR repeat protein